MSESKKSTPKTPPIIQEQESEQLSKVDSEKAKLEKMKHRLLATQQSWFWKD